VEPRAQRAVELTAVILMLVGSDRGVAVLPDWVIRDVKSHLVAVLATSVNSVMYLAKWTKPN
jgi:DNA-binding transcriptional LysR family regulator